MKQNKEEILNNPGEYIEDIMSNPELLEELKKNLGPIKQEQPKPWDILNPGVPKVEDAEAERRYAICLECPELLKITRQCKLCGCFMRVKTKLQDSYCPDGKW
jgi:hypothetical protein